MQPPKSASGGAKAPFYGSHRARLPAQSPGGEAHLTHSAKLVTAGGRFEVARPKRLYSWQCHRLSSAPIVGDFQRNPFLCATDLGFSFASPCWPVLKTTAPNAEALASSGEIAQRSSPGTFRNGRHPIASNQTGQEPRLCVSGDQHITTNA